MRQFFLLFFMQGFLCYGVMAQRNYAEAIQQGDVAFKRAQYKIALNKYFAVEAFDPLKKEEVKAKVKQVFNKVETLRIMAVRERANAIEAQEKEAQVRLEIETKARELQETSIQLQKATEARLAATKAELKQTPKSFEGFVQLFAAKAKVEDKI